MAASESIIPSSIFTSEVRSALHLLPRDPKRPFEIVSQDQSRELGEPVMLVRSPITTNPNSGVMLSGSSQSWRIADCGLWIMD
jgi:hypothetical protein